MYSSLLAAVASYLITKTNDKNARTTLEITFLSAGIVLAAFAIAHIFRVPALLDKERQAKEDTITKEFGDAKAEITRLTQEPDIVVKVHAVFWSSRKGEGGLT